MPASPITVPSNMSARVSRVSSDRPLRATSTPWRAAMRRNPSRSMAASSSPVVTTSASSRAVTATWRRPSSLAM